MMEQKNVNVSVDDGEDFFCHELSINFNPLQFIFDFKCVTPRVDVRSKQAPSIHIKHNVVMMDPFHVKRMLELLSKVMSDYEKEYGDVKKPKSVEKMEKKISAQHIDEKTVSVPSYFG